MTDDNQATFDRLRNVELNHGRKVAIQPSYSFQSNLIQSNPIMSDTEEGVAVEEVQMSVLDAVKEVLKKH